MRAVPKEEPRGSRHSNYAWACKFTYLHSEYHLAVHITIETDPLASPHNTRQKRQGVLERRGQHPCPVDYHRRKTLKFVLALEATKYIRNPPVRYGSLRYLRAPSSPARPLEDISILRRSCRYSMSMILKSSPPASAQPPGGGRGIAAWIRRPRTPASPGLRSGPVPPSSICHKFQHNTHTHTYAWDGLLSVEKRSALSFGYYYTCT